MTHSPDSAIIAHLKTKVISALRRLQKLPHIVRAFFADPDLLYITT
jgi:hypothetical protein